MRIGVISDTHGFLDPKIPSLFSEVDHILHAGDIGPQSIILALEQLAPVTAVLGNTDCFIPYRETEMIDLAGYCFLIHHIVDITSRDSTILSMIEKRKPSAVIYGHTHKKFSLVRNNTLFFNPGYAGKQRFDLPRSVGLIVTTQDGISHKWIDLD